MELTSVGGRVKVATGGPQIDGIVAGLPSASKAVVAVMDRARGPVLRTVDRSALSERDAEGPDDRALTLLLRRTTPALRGGASGGPSSGGARAGHARTSAHRTTGK